MSKSVFGIFREQILYLVAVPLENGLVFAMMKHWKFIFVLHDYYFYSLLPFLLAIIMEHICRNKAK